MEIQLEHSLLRPWRLEDVDSLVRCANHRDIARFLRDSFPHPYTYEEAQDWVEIAGAMRPQTEFAIEVDGLAVGGIGLDPRTDIFRKSAELGYWLGQRYWGRGICSEAVRAVTAWAFDTLQYQRIYAGVFSNNPASMRVLEKAGFTREALLKRAVYKNGQVLDEIIYATWPEDWQ